MSTDEWMRKITEDLKGADFNRKMVWRTTEGFDVRPFYRSEDTDNLSFINTLPGEYPYLRGKKFRNNNWLVRQNIVVTSYIEANKKALDILMKGIDSLGFIIADPESLSINNLFHLLDGINLDSIEVNILINGKAVEVLDILKTIIKDRRISNSELHGAVEADPLGRLIANGTLCIPVEQGMDYLAGLVKSSQELPDFKTIHLNASCLGNSGADSVQELSYALSAGSEYITQLTDRGVDAAVAASKIRFSFSTGPEYFMEIAKLRAARLLWSLVMKGFVPSGYEDIRMEIHSVTGRWNKTIYDPYVNMLRTQTEAMSAILGGADSVTVEPYDSIFRTPDEFSERIARNQQLILKEEAYFDKVADPSAGSYYIENLTSLVAENAWKKFISINEEGGLLESLKKGSLQKEIKASGMKRRKNASAKKLVLLGTNQYPDANEKVSGNIDSAKAFPERKPGTDLLIEPLFEFRAAEEIEKIRMEVENSGERPIVFMLTTGNQAIRRARSQFSMNFFGCAGYEVIDNYGFNTVEEGVKSALESKAEIVVLCSSDEEYPIFAPEAYELLKDKTIVVVAGNPPSAEELRSKGLELFIHIKSDIAETFSYYNNRLGIGR